MPRIFLFFLALILPFWRISPFLAFNSVFQRFSPMRLEKPLRTNCGTRRVCTKSCPQDGVIRLKWAPFGQFSQVASITG